MMQNCLNQTAVIFLNLMLRVDAHNGYQGKLNDLLEVNFSIMKCKVVHGVAKEG